MVAHDRANPDSVRLFSFDGHCSHLTTGFLLHMLNNNCICLNQPSHTSEDFQVADVGMILPNLECVQSGRARAGSARAHHLEKGHEFGSYDLYSIWISRSLTIVSFCRILAEARRRAFQPGIITAAWEAAGLYP